MIERGHPALSIGAQCRLLSISRSSFYHEPMGETNHAYATQASVLELISYLSTNDLKPSGSGTRIKKGSADGHAGRLYLQGNAGQIDHP